MLELSAPIPYLHIHYRGTAWPGIVVGANAWNKFL